MLGAARLAYNNLQLAVTTAKIMTFRTLATFLVLAGAAGAVHADAALSKPEAGGPAALASSGLPSVDHVVVRKSERRLYLMHGMQIVRSYHIELGLSPAGRKQRSGDFRTPEGSYRLAERNPRSDYFLSIKVSYPSPADLKRAHARHWDAGGSIMIHGLPNLMKHDTDYYESHDWTDGCIAVSNADMVEIWMLTPDDAPIDIYP